MKDIPFMAVGNEELGDTVGDTIMCPICGEQHEVKSSTGKPIGKVPPNYQPTTLQFYNCGKKSYLCGIDNRKIK